ncbi:hypothetical protein BSKO_02987 [Bryopsis sp. KO-2023]|nr:hypothetical protein BSKO_02987 [Bryopsis sp. KO-2023]
MIHSANHQAGPGCCGLGQRRALVPSSTRSTPSLGRTRPSIETFRRRTPVPSVLSVTTVRATAEKAAVETEGGESSIPAIGNTARTIVDLVSHGTLSTVSEDGSPLGTFVTYVLDRKGQPILRLRSSAVHTQNLLRSPRCSLFVQPEDLPARRLARVSLLGSVTKLSEDEEPFFRESHAKVHGEAVGVDAVRKDDLLYRLKVDDCFYVGGFGSSKCAESVGGEAYAEAELDPLRTAAAEIVSQWNKERAEDIVRICKQESGVSLQQLSYAELMWIDRLGMYIDYYTDSGEHSTLRVPFPRPVEDERDARSIITMTAQLAWERDRNYIPIIPPL